MEEEINNALKILKDGGIILYPTDTIWGIGCDALNEKAIQKIYELKHRPDSKSFIILLSEAKDIFNYTGAPFDGAVQLIQSATRPTTIIYDNAKNLPLNLINQDGSIAIRVTQDPFCKQLISLLGHPLVSTSANFSGAPSPQNFEGIHQKIKEDVDYVVNYRQEERFQPRPSRIIKLDNLGNITVIRE